MENISILGTGAMGSCMAANLLEAGYKVTVFNRTQKRALSLELGGAIIAPSPRQAVKDADIIISMLRDDDASRAVWLDKEFGAVLGLKENAIAIECSTLSSVYCQELAEYITSHGEAFLDAPVAGSRPQVEACQLIHLVGGDANVLKSVRDVLSVSASAIHHVGPIGAGMNMKLAVNAIFGIQVAALGEMLSALGKAGISKDEAVGILNELPVTSPALKGVGMLMANGNHAPLFPIELVEKDFKYAQLFVEAADLEPIMTESARCTYQHAIDKGFGADNISGVIQLFEN